MSIVESFEPARMSHGTARAPMAVLFTTVFVDLLGFGIVIPFLPMYAAQMGIGAFKIGLILSIYSLMQLLAAPILGRLSDHIGRRPVIMLGLLGSSVSYVIYGFAGSFVGLLLSRGVHGACAATVSTAQAYVADTTSETGRAQGMGMIGAAFGLGFVLGPAIGGLLGHSSLRVPAFIAAIITFANLIFAATSLPESLRSRPVEPFRWHHLAQPLLILPRQLTRHRMTRFFLIAFLATFAMAIFETTFALIAPLFYGYRAAGIGGLFAFAGVVQAVTQGYLLGKLVKLVGEKRLICIGLLLFAIGMAPMASFRSSTMLLVLLATLALGYGFANPAIASLISKRSGRSPAGRNAGREPVGAGAGADRRPGCGRDSLRCDRAVNSICRRRTGRGVRCDNRRRHRSADLGRSATLSKILIFHVFGVVLWIGSLLVVSSLMARVPDEVGAAREALIVASRRLLGLGSTIAAGVTIIFGIGAIMAEPVVLKQGWLHAKLLLVLIMVGCHVRLYRRVVALENAPSSGTGREFSILHGVVSVLLLLILALVFLQPF